MYTLGGYMHLIVQRRHMMADTLTLSIEGMHCGGCIRRVTSALESVEGVEVGSVEVGSAQMIFDPNGASAEEIAAAVDRIGFFAHIEKA
jgi:copper chaperone CopZ